MNLVEAEGREGKERSLPSFVCPRGLLTAVDVRVSRGGREVLSLSTCLSAGAWIGLVGPNGSGKTTLLRVLKGVLQPDSGRVELAGTPVAPFDPRVGLVLANPEDQGVSPVVADDVAFGLENLGLPAGEVRKRVREYLELLGIWDLRNAQTSELSGGAGQKLAIASVLALGARFLLLDEATSMLSPPDRDSVLASLTALRGVGVGILQVTHRAEELLWVDEVLALEAGKAVFKGAADDFFLESVCPWRRPPYLDLRDYLRQAGADCPRYSHFMKWLERGG